MVTYKNNVKTFVFLLLVYINYIIYWLVSKQYFFFFLREREHKLGGGAQGDGEAGEADPPSLSREPEAELDPRTRSQDLRIITGAEGRGLTN